MHGLILTSLLDFAGRRESDGFRADRAYPDEDFEELVQELAAERGVSRDDLLRRFGRFAATTTFLRLHPEYYAESSGTREFLLDVERRIHELVRATVPDARPPHLRVAPLGAEGVAVTYTSDRRLCAMLEGLVEGVALHYGETFSVTHKQCMLRGDLGCAVFVEPADD